MDSFTPCELEVMQVLWRDDPLKPAEILEQLDRPLTNPALRSTLRVLMEKGHVTRRKKGKAYFYRPKKSAPTSLKKMSRRLAELFCGGSSYELIAELIKSEKLSDDDLRQLQELAKETSSTRKPSAKGK
jgi:BlaI family transcriptional regulator, penicillinase repressor